MKPHVSGENYLETVLVLQEKLGIVRSVNAAQHMKVLRPSVYHAAATSRNDDSLTIDEDYFLHLTNVGCEVTEKIYK